MLQQKKSYSDVLETGTSTKLKNPPYQKDSITGRVTLDWWKVYLGSCAPYPTYFVESMLANTQQVKTELRGCFNSSILVYRGTFTSAIFF